MPQSVSPDHRNRRGIETRAAILDALADYPEGVRMEVVAELVGREVSGVRRQLDIMYSLGTVTRKKAPAQGATRDQPPPKVPWLWLAAPVERG